MDKLKFEWIDGLWYKWRAITPIGTAAVERKNDGLFHFSFNGRRSKAGSTTPQEAQSRCEHHMIREAKAFIQSLEAKPAPETTG